MRSTIARKKFEDQPLEGLASNALGVLDENGNEYFEKCLKSNPNKMN